LNAEKATEQKLIQEKKELEKENHRQAKAIKEKEKEAL